MNHYIIAGYFDPQFITRGKLVKTHELDPEIVYEILSSCASIDPSGRYMVDGFELVYRDGYIVCPWLVPHPLAEAIQLLRKLNERTDCILADIGCREIVNVEDLLPSR